MKLLHPIMPFLTEEVWQILSGSLGRREAESIMIAPWPKGEGGEVNDDIERQMDMVQSLIGTIRNIRSEMNVPLGQKADAIVAPADADAERVFGENRAYILDLAAVRELSIERGAVRPPKSAAGISGRSEVFVKLAGLVDFDRERARLKKEVERRRNFIASIDNKLNNEAFIARAPEAVVEQERRKLIDVREELNKLVANLEALGD
jgi:valyl-tRNA synthetase